MAEFPMSPKKLLILASALVATGSPLAMGDMVVSVSREQVRYDDLNLSTNAGVAALYARLRGAALRACSPLDSRQLSLTARYRVCVDDAMSTAVAELNHPRLSQYFESKGGILSSVTVVAKSP